MVWFFFVAGALLVFVIAAVLVGSVTFRLGHETPPAIFDLDEAVFDVGDRLSETAASRLSYDEVRALILFELDHLAAKGVSAFPGEELEPLAGPPVVIADDDSVAVVLGRAELEGLDVADEDVFAVIEALLAHLGDIGAVGPAVDGPVDPDGHG